MLTLKEILRAARHMASYGELGVPLPRDTSRFRRFYPEARAVIREDADPHLPYLTSYEVAAGETLIRAKTEKPTSPFSRMKDGLV